ncbi:hypothetical protein CIRG_06387 [Coccidioides immitis RMSCC 2394]|uniref:Uncharacterized protein n=1 Tax=Coccidioides immitis RMSCC 2394 TaxID=404692 RepID=A0A0J6YDB5_COCIT|nr:hypothetical protein CIRG_06387 [Coccidioides immitis RMSCC 2394]
MLRLHRQVIAIISMLEDLDPRVSLHPKDLCSVVKTECPTFKHARIYPPKYVETNRAFLSFCAASEPFATETGCYSSDTSTTVSITSICRSPSLAHHCIRSPHSSPPRKTPQEYWNID